MVARPGPAPAAAAARSPAPAAALRRLHARVRRCTACADRGWIATAAPVLPEPVPTPFVLVGQAPGRVEEGTGRPFSGRSGSQLFRWLARAGCGPEPEARRRIYCTSVTKCFPGPPRSGSGDRRPSSTEVACCRPFLDAQLSLLRPRVVIAVGGLAQGRFLPRRPLELLVGRCFDAAGDEVEPGAAAGRGAGAPRPWIVPLPHPSGASRWLNRRANAALLERALLLLGGLLRAEADPG